MHLDHALQVRLPFHWSCRRHVKLRLIEQACRCSMVRGGGGLKEVLHARLCRWHSSSGECLPPRPMHLHLQVRLHCRQRHRHVKQRLIEQACGCSMVRGGGGLKEVRARLCGWHSSGGECLPPTTMHLHLQVRLLLKRSCRRHVKQRLIEQACGCSTMR